MLASMTKVVTKRYVHHVVPYSSWELGESSLAGWHSRPIQAASRHQAYITLYEVAS